MNDESNQSNSFQIGIIIFIVLGLVAVFFIWQVAGSRRHGRGHSQTEATSNARQIGLALFEFETEYGAFPNDETVEVFAGGGNPDGGPDLSGQSSNALFRQIFAANITQSEQMFYARIKDSRKPDGDMIPGNLLAPREVRFSYISGLTSKNDPLTPIALTPLIPGTTTFDPRPFDGKAVVLLIDNSVRSYAIARDGHIYRDGFDLLSPRHPVWNGKAPDIRYPE